MPRHRFDRKAGDALFVQNRFCRVKDRFLARRIAPRADRAPGFVCVFNGRVHDTYMGQNFSEEKT